MLLDSREGFHRHGDTVTADTPIPSTGWTAVFRQRTSEFEGDLTAGFRFGEVRGNDVGRYAVIVAQLLGERVQPLDAAGRHAYVVGTNGVVGVQESFPQRWHG